VNSPQGGAWVSPIDDLTYDMTAMHTAATSQQPPSPGAARMRRFRERRRLGKVRFAIELDPIYISGLVELGWLKGSQRDDRSVVMNAFCRFVAFALDMTRNTGW
jgi:hypothetical protein